MDVPPSIRFLYRFEFDDREAKEFEVILDSQSLELRSAMPEEEAPDWARLEVGTCSGCPLSCNETRTCPAALSLVEVFEFFARAQGHDEALVTVETRERTYLKRCSLQVGISSLMGLILPASGCPIVAPLRPLVRSHLPFATSYETVPRIASWYLLQQYFDKRSGRTADWELSELAELYKRIESMNRGLTVRLDHQKVDDASRNAVVHLGVFGELLNFSITEDTMRDVLDSLFD
ncbi:MAG: hypothetical protein GY723_18775 [bacterium]|nr:hypothetical protein [bacterium]MCP5068351.1 hypothetical protein [bacterium]